MKNLGKIIAFLCGFLALFLIVFLMNSPSNSKKNSSNLEKNLEQNLSKKSLNSRQNLEQNLNEPNSSFADEIKKIKQLEKSMRKAPENLSKLYLVNCAPCHFKDGKGEIAPSIAGQSKGEILSKLKIYKENERKNALMHELLINLSDENLENLAEEISKFK